MTTRNRFIIYIQSWPVKPASLLFGWILLPLLSCVDNAALVGFRKDPKINTTFVEIPLQQSVFLRSPVSTQNFTGETLARILIGRYADPHFGNMEARGNFTYSPPLQRVFPELTSVYESLELQLKFDYYSYGSNDSTDQQLEVFEVTEPIGSGGDYYNTTVPATKPAPTGTITFAVGPSQLAEGWKKYNDLDLANNTYFTLSIPLGGTLGQDLFDDVKNNPARLENFNDFIAQYPGLSVTMPFGNKILGVTPVYGLPAPELEDSKLILKYRNGATSFSVVFPIYLSTIGSTVIPVVSFSSITSDRNETQLDGMLPFQDLVPLNKNLYVQSGTGILSKLDLGEFYKHFESLDNIIVNGAEIVLTNTSSERPPQVLELRVLDGANQFRTTYYDTIINGEFRRLPSDPYLIKIRKAIVASGPDQTNVSVLTDLSGPIIPVDQETRKVNKVFLTEFFQQLYNYKSDSRRIKALSIFPSDNEFAKTTSSLTLDPSSATLRIYYSKPITFQ